MKSALEKFYVKMYEENKGKVSSLKLITPEIAAEYDKKNKDNYRSKRNTHIERLANDILNYRWTISGQTITFDKNGTLVDGQHRLAAIIRAGVSVPNIVVFNLPSESKLVVDDRPGRTLSDRLGYLEKDHKRILASTLNLAYSVDKNTQKKFSGSHPELIDYLEDHQEIELSVSKYSFRNANSPISPTVASFCHYSFSKISADYADEFLSKLIYGNELKKEDPIFILRNFIFDTKRRGSKIESKFLISYIFQVWNAKRENKKITRQKLVKRMNVIPSLK